MLNSSKKSTFPLFESVCLLDGVIQNPKYHIERFKWAHQKFYGEKPGYGLFEGIHIPAKYRSGTVKLRISYAQEAKEIHFGHYQKKPLNTLQTVFDAHIDYDLKFEDRTPLNALYHQRGACDDILIIKNGLVTDTAYTNILFLKDRQWFTPHSYLLNGTCRQKLLDQGLILEREVGFDDIHNYRGFQLINAMLGFHPKLVLPITNIKKTTS